MLLQFKGGIKIKRLKRIAAFLAVAFATNTSAVLAEIPKGTVVIGDRAFSMSYANDDGNVEEIREALKGKGDIFIKTMRGEWIDNSTSKKINKDGIPRVLYKSTEGKYFLYDPEDGSEEEIVLVVESKDQELPTGELKGNVYINEDDITFENAQVKGKVFVDPGKDGNSKLKEVTSDEVMILSGGEKGINFEDVKSEKLTVQSSSVVRVESTKDTDIKNTEIKSSAVIEASKGSLGKIVVNIDEATEDAVVEFKGKFDEDIIIKSPIQVKFTDCTAKTVVAEADVDLKVSDKSDIKNIEDNGNKVMVNGKEHAPVIMGGGGGGGFVPTPTPPKPEPKPEIKVKSLEIAGENLISVTTESSIQLNAKVILTDGKEQELSSWSDSVTGEIIKWWSDDSSVAEVKGGLVTTKKDGSAYIGVRVDYKGSQTAKEVRVDVYDKIDEKLNLEKVVINNNPKEASMSVGEVLQLEGEATFSDKTTSSAIKWRSSNDQVAYIKNGQVNAVAEGETEITGYYKHGGVTLSDSVKVKVATIEGIISSGGIVKEDSDMISLYLTENGTKENPVKFIASKSNLIEKNVRVVIDENQFVELVGLNIKGDLAVVGKGGNVAINNVNVQPKTGNFKIRMVTGAIDIYADQSKVKLDNGTKIENLRIIGSKCEVDLEKCDIKNLSVERKTEDVGVRIFDGANIDTLFVTSEDCKFINKTSYDNFEKNIDKAVFAEIDPKRVLIESADTDNLLELIKKVNTYDELKNSADEIIREFKLDKNVSTDTPDYTKEYCMSQIIWTIHYMDLNNGDESLKVYEELLDSDLSSQISRLDVVNKTMVRIGEYFDYKIESLESLIKMINEEAYIDFRLEDALKNINGYGKYYPELVTIDVSGMKAGEEVTEVLGYKDEKNMLPDFLQLRVKKVFMGCVEEYKGKFYLLKNYQELFSMADNVLVEFEILFREADVEGATRIVKTNDVEYKIEGLHEGIIDRVDNMEMAKEGNDFKIVYAGDNDIEKLRVYFNDVLLDTELEFSKAMGKFDSLKKLKVINSQDIKKDEGIIKVVFGDKGQYEFARRVDLKENKKFSPIYQPNLPKPIEDSGKIYLKDLKKSEDNSEYYLDFEIENILFSGEVIDEADVSVNGRFGLWLNNSYTSIDNFEIGDIEVLDSTDNRIMKVRMPIKYLKDVKEGKVTLCIYVDGERSRVSNYKEFEIILD